MSSKIDGVPAELLRRAYWELDAGTPSIATLAELKAVLDAPVVERQAADEFQYRIKPWLLDCFGEKIASDKQERNHRFLEEALELVQACGATAGEAHQLVDYVYGRDIGDPVQEVGGVMVTLAALCLANDLDMHEAGETELARIWTKVEQIRAKQAAKPNMSPLPGAYPDRASPPAPVVVNARMAAILQSLRTNANPALFAPGQLAEVDACLDKVKEMNR